MIAVAFFNNRGGVGATTLVQHLASIFADSGQRVLAVDLDPQAHLTSAFLPLARCQELWAEDASFKTVFSAVRPLLHGSPNLDLPDIEDVDENLGLVVSDVRLSAFEDMLADTWSNPRKSNGRAALILTAFSSLVRRAADLHQADWVFIDVGPNLTAINRAALMASTHLIIPIGSDISSLHSLGSLGTSLRQWRTDWEERKAADCDPLMDVLRSYATPIGYVRPSINRLGYRRLAEISGTFHNAILKDAEYSQILGNSDPYEIGTLRHYHSLRHMSKDAQKPMFALKPADGAIGAHSEAVRQAYNDFSVLAKEIAKRTGGVFSAHS